MMHAVQCGTCGTRNAPGVETCVGCGRAIDPGQTGGGTEATESGAGGPPPTGPPSAGTWEPPPPPAPGPGGSWEPPPRPASGTGSSWEPPPPPAPGQAPSGPGPAAGYASSPQPSGASQSPGYPPPPGGPARPGGPPPAPGGQYPPAGYPPGGYPPAGPPGYAPPAYGGPQPPQRPRRKSRRLLVALAVLVVVGLVAGAVFVLTRGGDGDEVVLEPVGMVQEDDFAGNLDIGEAAGEAFGALEVPDEVPDARVEQVDTGLAGQVVDGSEPAVYGGSRDTQVCDVAALTAFLTDPANADKAEAWAGVQGIEVGDIESYVSGLTAVRLRWDTRVTNHGFRDGEATPFQSLLQAGTAVLVDETGVPRVKCNCGNPLGEPTGLGTSQSSALDVDGVAQNPDDAWEDLDPAEAVKIEAGAAALEAITLLDVDTLGLIDRPVGSDGASETDTGTGDVKVTLEWASDADIDLAVTEPDGTTISYLAVGPTATGGQLDVDANRECENTGGVENIFWPPGEAPSGGYTVTVDGFRLSRDDGSSCGGGDFTLTITVEGQERVETGTVGQDEQQTFTFEVP
jgi:hypothetical protein